MRALIAATICSLALGAIAEPALAHFLDVPFEAIGMGRAAHPVAFVLALGVVVYAHTVIGEMVPKNLTLAGPERVLEAANLEVAVLTRTTARRAFRRILEPELTPLLTAPA